MLRATDLALAGRLHGVTAALRPGEITAICGPNGAGKSTLLACLAGLLTPDDGEVALGDQRLVDIPARERARAIGFLQQSPEIAWDISVATLVSLGRLPWGDRDAAAIGAALTAMELGELGDRPVSQLSGGERARALMARVLAGQPRWLLADEPLANLDLAHQLTLLARLRAEADAGRGVVLVLHDLAQAINHADRVLVLEAGKLVEDGPGETALAADVIARVWGVQAEWLGAPGSRALALG